MNRTVFTLLLLLLADVVMAQKEASVWYFGEKAGLDFRSGVPVPLYDGQLQTNEGCATVSDPDGNLLFYTNGETVWNRAHEVMAGGTGLMGGYSSSQSALVIPFPGNDSLYYIFTTAQEDKADGFRYSVVNMKRGGGLGEVVEKNVLLLADVYEKVSAVKLRNCEAYWVLARLWNSDEYYAYPVTISGIGDPVVSKSGNFIGGTPENSCGQMKSSPDGQKVAAAFTNKHDFVELLDFDAATGRLSNARKLVPNPPRTEMQSPGVYGVEFSPNSQLLYVASIYPLSTPARRSLYQYNVSYADAAQIVASKTLIDSSQNTYGLQLGPDKKIYLTHFNQWLSVISNPDVEGLGCGYTQGAIDLGTSAKVGLPTFVQSYFADPIIAAGNCEFQNISFSLQNRKGVSSVQWDFGDPASAADNSSSALAPTHIFSSQGTYTVRLVYNTLGGCTPDTVYKQVYAGPFKLYLGRDTTLCEGDTLHLAAVGIPGATYLWNTGATDPKVAITRPGTYWVRATLGSFCQAVDTIQVSFRSLPSFSLGWDTAICVGQPITLSPQPESLSADYTWSTGARGSQIVVSEPGTYWLQVAVPRTGFFSP